MKATTPVNWQCLIRIATGTATTEELQQINEWIGTAPEMHQPILDHVIAIYKADNPDNMALREKVRSRVAQQLPEVFRDATTVLPLVATPRRKPLIWLRRMAIAASVALILLIVTGKQELVRQMLNSGQKTLAWKTVNTAFGQEASITLPDGSTVRLSPGSRLEYPEQFSGNERQVKLEGAAFFDVRKNPQQPFIVQAHQLYTKVLGTSFEVVAYANEPQSTVTLITGKVMVHRKGPKNTWEAIACLTPNKKLVLEHQAETFTVDSINLKTSQDIQQGKLVFDNNTLQEIATGLNRRFNIHTRFKNGCNPGKHISATFDQSMSLQDISLILSNVSGLHIIPQGDSLYISY